MPGKVLISRPMVSTGRETGFLPGSVESKMKHWLQPMTDAAAGQGSQVQLTDDQQQQFEAFPPDRLRGLCC